MCSSAQNFTLNGNASNLGGGCYRLTASSSYQVGSAWNQNNLNLNAPFDLRFDVKFGNSDGGADGLAFVLQGQGLNAIGAVGSSLGYAVNAPADPAANGIIPSLAVEFDTFWDGSGGDPGYDHIAIMRDGIKDHTIAANTVAAPVEALSGGLNIEDGNYHRVQITWNPTTELLSVYLDCDLRISTNVDLQNDIFSSGNPVYWGFTASTGGLSNNHEFCLVQPTIIQLNSASNDVFICPGGSANLGVTIQSPGTIQWTPATGLSSTVIQSPIASPLVNTTYTVTSTDICGEVTTEIVNVNIIDPPNVSAGNDLEFCQNTTVTATATASEAGSFDWSTPNGSIVGSSTNATVDVDAGGTYNVEFTSSLTGCTASDALMISELPIPNPNLTNPYLICPGGTLQLSLGNAWDQVQWPDGSSFFNYTVNQPGNYNVLISDDGCSNNVEFIVQYPLLSPPNLGADISICMGESAHLTAGISGVWSNGVTATSIDVQSPGTYFITVLDQGCAVGDTIQVFTFLPPALELGADHNICRGDTAFFEVFVNAQWPDGSTGMNYYTRDSGVIVAHASNGPCYVEDSAHVFITEIPYVSIIGDSALCEGTTIYLGLDAAYYTQLRWNTGDTSKIISVTEAGIYQVGVESECGADVDRIEIEYEDCEEAVFIPNAFTPDGDGINDVLSFSTKNISTFAIDIFDRWGNVVFSSKDPSEKWLGDVQGDGYYAPNGIYHYRYVVTLKSLDVFERSGFILLMR